MVSMCRPARRSPKSKGRRLNCSPLNAFSLTSFSVATHTRAHVLALGSSPTKLLDTRKTTPGFRMLEKYAVGQGGGYNHRLGLFDRIMVKDNHLAAGGATAGERLTSLVRRAQTERPDLLVEVEVDRLDQLAPALASPSPISAKRSRSCAVAPGRKSAAA